MFSWAAYKPLSIYASDSPQSHTYTSRTAETTTTIPTAGSSDARPQTRLKYTLPVVLLLLLYLFWELHIELSLYRRSWVRQEVEPLTPLRGCFRPQQVSPLYNVTERLYGPRITEVHSGMAMRHGLDCYDFAGTIRPSPSSSALARDQS